MSRRKEVTTVCFDKDVYEAIEKGKSVFLEKNGVQLSTSAYIAYLVRKYAETD